MTPMTRPTSRILEYRRVPPTRRARRTYYAAGITVVVGVILLALLLQFMLYLAIRLR